MPRTDLKTIVAMFDRDRLRVAREAAGKTQSELAVAVGVNATTISQYEKGHAKPSPAKLSELALHLQVPVEFFGPDHPLADAVAAPGFYRKLKSAPAAQRHEAAAKAVLLWDLVCAIERWVELPRADVPSKALPADADKHELEEAAEHVRLAWALPHGPLPHLVRLIEAHGVVVARITTGTSKLDAFSRAFPQRQVIVLTSDKGDRARGRFDAAHELGHLVMHTDVPEDAGFVEPQANAFASAFLMPAADIIDELPNRLHWPTFFDLKRRWGVSLQALLMRARTLEVMSDDAYVRAMKAVSARGWRKREPVNLGPPEAPSLLERAVDLLGKGGIGLDEIVREAALHEQTVIDLLRLASDHRPKVRVLDD